MIRTIAIVMIVAAANERDRVESYPQAATAIGVQASCTRFIEDRLEWIAASGFVKSKECSDWEQHDLDNPTYNPSLDGDSLVLRKQFVSRKDELKLEAVDDPGDEDTVTLN